MQHEYWPAFIGILFLATVVGGGAAFVLNLRREVRAKRAAMRPEFPWRRILAPAALLSSSGAFDSPAAPLLAAVLAVVFVFVEWPLHRIFIPLGLVRAAYFVSRLARYPVAAVPPEVGPAFLAARALARRPNERAAQFLEARLACISDLSALGVAAMAVIALSRGQRERALGIVRGLSVLTSPTLGGEVKSFVHELLALDAATRGDWIRIAQHAELPRGTPLLHLFGSLAARIGDAPDAPSNWRLWWRWLRAPGRRTTWPLVRSVMVGAGAHPKTVEAQKPTRALDALSDFAARCPLAFRSEHVVAAVRSLDALRGSEQFKLELERRSTSLGVPSGRVLGAVLQTAEQGIASAMLHADRPRAWLPPGPSADAIRSHLAEARLDSVRRLASELYRRMGEKQDLEEADEWHVWGQLKGAAEQVLRDAVSHDDYVNLFTVLHRPLWRYGYRQSFVLERRTLGRNVFGFQQELAQAARAGDTLKTIGDNLAASLLQFQKRDDEPGGVAHFDRERTQKLRRRLRAYAASPLLLGVGIMSLLVQSAGFALVALWGGFGLCRLLLALTHHRVVELHDTDEGLVLQTEERLLWVRPQDLELRPVGRGIVRLSLRRSPRWLPRRLWTVHKDVDAALASVKLLKAVHLHRE